MPLIIWRTSRIFTTLLSAMIICVVYSKPLEGPIWINNNKNVPFLMNYLNRFRRNSLQENYPIFYQPVDKNTLMPYLNTDDIVFEPKFHKRALTMFGRWGFIDKLGKERSSIRSSRERVNASSNRKLGYPVRFG